MKIQSCIMGFGGKPSCVLSLYDETSGVLVVSKIVPHRKDRFDDCLVISNTELPAREVLYDEGKFNESISTYLEMKNCGLIDILPGASQSDPGNAFETEGVRETGRRIYRFNPDMSNAQVAVIATAWYVKQAQSVSKVLSMQSRLLDIQQGNLITI